MSNKYIVEGAAFDGDGTTSAVAVSAGAPGAWNTITYFEGAAPAYGTLAAGDVVYIRSKDITGADIVRTVGAAISLGSVVGNTWVIDGGNMWPGVVGVVAYRRSANFAVSLRTINTFLADNPGQLQFQCEYVAANVSLFINVANSILIKNAKIDANRVTYSSSGPWLVSIASSSSLVFINLRIDSGNKCAKLITLPDYARPIFINPHITLATVVGPIFITGSQSYGGGAAVFGGTIDGVGADTGQVLLSTVVNAGMLELYGLDFPKTMTSAVTTTGTFGGQSGVLGMGLDRGLGAIINRRFGLCDSRTVNSYPTLNATFPDSAATPWSWYVYPTNTSVGMPIELPFHKVYTDTAAVKTITVELLVGDTFSVVNQGNLWVDVMYVDDTTGLMKYVSTLNPLTETALTPSAAGWTSVAWGAVSCVKRKIVVTTPTSIKQDTMITMILGGTCKAVGAGHVLFVDPDPQLTTP